MLLLGHQPFRRGMVLVSHDMRLISQVAEEVWNVGRWRQCLQGDIGDYKDSYVR